MLKKPAGQAWNDWLYNDRPGFGRVQPDLGGVPKDIDTLFVTGKAAQFERLLDLPALRRLSVREISQAQLELIAGLGRLTELRVFGFRGADAGPLANLEKLEFLTLEWAPKIETISWLGALERLRVLVVGDLKRIQDFAPVAELAGLRYLSISGGATTVQTVADTAPLARLTKLEELQFRARVPGEDLSPLAAMTWLERLGIPDDYPVRVYAELAAHLTRTECPSFAPTRSYVLSGETFIGLIGKPVRQFKAGDPKSRPLIAKREAEFSHWLEHYKAKRGD